MSSARRISAGTTSMPNPGSPLLAGAKPTKRAKPQLGADAICLRVVVTGQGLEASPQTTAKATIAANAAILAEPRERRLRLSWRGGLGRGRGFGLKNG